MTDYLRDVERGGALFHRALLYSNIRGDVDYTIGLMARDIRVPGAHIYDVAQGDMRVYSDRVRIALRSVPSDGFSTLPIELITRIASFLYNTDLYHFMSTCRAVNNTSGHLLLRRPIWNPSSMSTTQTSLWNDQTEPLKDIPRSLTLTRYSLSIDADVMSKIRPLTNLSTLRFILSDLSRDLAVYDILPLLPALRNLSFLNCVLPPCPVHISDGFVNLPLTELDLVKMSWGNSGMDHAIDDSGAYEVYGGLRLACASSLTILRITLDSHMLGVMLSMDIPPQTSTITTLELEGIQSYTRNDQLRLTVFCSHPSFQTVRRLQMINTMCLHSTGLHFDFHSLDTFYGAIHCSALSNSCNTLRHIVLNNVPNSDVLFDGVPCLPMLETFEVLVMNWEASVFQLAVARFPQVVDLRILYFVTETPEKGHLIHFFVNELPLLPYLQVFHYYRKGPYHETFRFSVVEDDIDAVQPLLSDSNLTEVRLQSPAVWRRTNDTAKWTLRVEEVDTLLMESLY